MALKDNAGLVKMFAMIDIQRYQNVAVGDTLEETEKAYKQLLRNNGVLTEENGDQATITDGSATGTISVLSPVVIGGDSHYYIMLSGDGTLYDCPVTSVVDIVRYKEGDSVTLNFSAGGGSVVVVDSVQSAQTSTTDQADQAAA